MDRVVDRVVDGVVDRIVGRACFGARSLFFFLGIFLFFFRNLKSIVLVVKLRESLRVNIYKGGVNIKK